MNSVMFEYAILNRCMSSTLPSVCMFEKLFRELLSKISLDSFQCSMWISTGLLTNTLIFTVLLFYIGCELQKIIILTTLIMNNTQLAMMLLWYLTLVDYTVSKISKTTLLS